MKNIFRKAFTLTLMASVALFTYAQRPTVRTGEVSIAPGGQQAVNIYIDDVPDDSISSFDVKVTLPEGFDFVNLGTNRRPRYAAKGGRTEGNIYSILGANTIVTEADGRQSCRMSVLNMSGSTKPFDPDNTKSVLSFTIEAPESFPAVATINLSNIELVGKAARLRYAGTKDSPYTGTGTINNAGIERPTFTFAGLDTLKLRQGETASVTINSSWNEDALEIGNVVYQLTLPEGLSFVPDEDGSYLKIASPRFDDYQSTINGKTNSIKVVLYDATGGSLPGSPEEFATVTVKADSLFDGVRNLDANYDFTTVQATTAAKGNISKAITVEAPVAPAFALAPDTLALNEGGEGNVTLAVTVPEGTKPTVAGAITLPEGITFADGDGTFNIAGVAADTTLTFAVKAGKAYEGVKQISVAANATSEFGTEYPAFADTINVTVAQLAAPTYVFAPETLNLKEGETGNVTLAVTIPEGTKATVTGAVTLPEDVTFAEGDGTFTVAADTTLTFAVKAGKAFEGTKDIAVAVNATSELGTVYETFADTIKVSVYAPGAPQIAFANDSIELREGEETEIALNITNLDGKTTLNGTVTLPEELTFVGEYDGTINVTADADTTVTFSVKAGKAYEGYKNITTALTAASEAGSALGALADTLAVTIATPEAPVIAFAETDSLALEEEATAAIVVNIDIPEGTEIGQVTGTITLPAGIVFDENALSSVEIEDGTVNANGRTATFTANAPANGKLLTINIKTNADFNDAAITVAAQATTVAGTEFDLGTIERTIVNKTAAGIDGVRAEMKSYDGAIYNINGQRVSKSYKGVVIMNGKKYIAK